MSFAMRIITKRIIIRYNKMVKNSSLMDSISYKGRAHVHTHKIIRRFSALVKISND